MKKVLMALSVISLLALPGCCCQRKSAPKKAVQKPAAKKKAPTRKVKVKKPKKHAHIELESAEELLA